MKILLSAYACEPGQGSEPGVGWHWALEIARLGHEVHVLTRPRSVAPIARGLSELEGVELNVHSYDIPLWTRWWYKGRRGMHLHYHLWQWYAYRRARMLHAKERFDLVHHITFGVYRHPSFMGGLGIPFILGPIGGGESSPPALLRSAPWRAKTHEFLRSAINRIAATDPLVRNTFRSAALILCKTQETLAFVPPRLRQKCICLLEIAAEREMLAQSPSIGSVRAQFLYAGRLLHWKGIHLIIRALEEVRRDVPDATLIIVGKGRDHTWLQSVAQKYGVETSVEWRGQLARAELIKLYSGNTALVFPSLHDSSGNVVMEALSQGLPVICLDLGGPGALLPDNCGIKIAARERTEEQVVSALAEAMKRVANDSELRSEFAANALAEARRQTWESVVSRAYKEIDKVLARG